jgi:hypothetical protein
MVAGACPVGNIGNIEEDPPYLACLHKCTTTTKKRSPKQQEVVQKMSAQLQLAARKPLGVRDP